MVNLNPERPSYLLQENPTGGSSPPTEGRGNLSSSGQPTSNGGPQPPNQHEEGGSFRLLTVAGIPLRLHWTFFALLIWVAFSSLGSRTGASPMGGVGFLLALFGCVVLHELGHALTALRYGIRTHSITLYPIGGVARLEQMPNTRQELWIALAGPAVNVVLAAIFYLVTQLLGESITEVGIEGAKPHFLTTLFWVNVSLVGFNMLPAFPMDGGRVLRSILARFTDDLRATLIAARIGQGMAILLGLFGLWQGHLLLMFIAVFVYLGAAQEANAFQTKTLMTGHRVRDAMLREIYTLKIGSTLREAADLLLAQSQADFPVMHGNEVMGVLSRSALMRGLASEGQDAYVAGIMERDFPRVHPDADLQEALAQVQGSYGVPILVMETDGTGNAQLVGMVTQENLLEFLMLTQIQATRTPRPT